MNNENVRLTSHFENILQFYGYDLESFNNPLTPDVFETTAGTPLTLTSTSSDVTTIDMSPKDVNVVTSAQESTTFFEKSELSTSDYNKVESQLTTSVSDTSESITSTEETISTSQIPESTHSSRFTITTANSFSTESNSEFTTTMETSADVRSTTIFPDALTSGTEPLSNVRSTRDEMLIAQRYNRTEATVSTLVTEDYSGIVSRVTNPVTTAVYEMDESNRQLDDSNAEDLMQMDGTQLTSYTDNVASKLDAIKSGDNSPSTTTALNDINKKEAPMNEVQTMSISSVITVEEMEQSNASEPDAMVNKMTPTNLMFSIPDEDVISKSSSNVELFTTDVYSSDESTAGVVDLTSDVGNSSVTSSDTSTIVASTNSVKEFTTDVSLINLFDTGPAATNLASITSPATITLTDVTNSEFGTELTNGIIEFENDTSTVHVTTSVTSFDVSSGEEIGVFENITESQTMDQVNETDETVGDAEYSDENTTERVKTESRGVPKLESTSERNQNTMAEDARLDKDTEADESATNNSTAHKENVTELIGDSQVKVDVTDENDDVRENISNVSKNSTNSGRNASEEERNPLRSNEDKFPENAKVNHTEIAKLKNVDVNEETDELFPNEENFKDDTSTHPPESVDVKDNIPGRSKRRIRSVHHDNEVTFNQKVSSSSRRKRSLVDYVIARYHDKQSHGWRGSYEPHESLSFLIYGRIKEPNINFMNYDTVLPFVYISTLNAMALRFPLDSKEYYLLILLPVDVHGVDRLIYDLKSSSITLKEIINSLKYTHVRAVIPSFMLKGYVILTSTLQKVISIVALTKVLRTIFSWE